MLGGGAGAYVGYHASGGDLNTTFHGATMGMMAANLSGAAVRGIWSVRRAAVPRGAHGLFGIADRPVRGLRSSHLKEFYLQQVTTPQFSSRLARYNRWAKRLGVKTASADEIAEALTNSTTFHETNQFRSSLHVRANHGPSASFRIQGNPTSWFFPKSTAWHEAAHLGAALRGQSDKLFRGGLTHELLVHVTMSPELFGTVVGGSAVIIGGTVIYVNSQ